MHLNSNIDRDGKAAAALSSIFELQQGEREVSYTHDTVLGLEGRGTCLAGLTTPVLILLLSGIRRNKADRIYASLILASSMLLKTVGAFV